MSSDYGMMDDGRGWSAEDYGHDTLLVSGIEVQVGWTCTSCPVQADVALTRDGIARVAYFRARGSCWELTIWPPGFATVDAAFDAPAEWSVELDWGNEYAAGWMTRAQARALIAWAVEQWAAGKDVLGLPPSMGPGRES